MSKLKLKNKNQEKIYVDAVWVFLLKDRVKGITLTEACEIISTLREVTPANIRLNICGNLGLTAADWNNLDKERIACALIEHYPHHEAAIRRIFGFKGKCK